MTNVHTIHTQDSNRSTVVEEIDAMDWQFSNLFRLIAEMEGQNSESSREYLAKEARRRLDTIVQRAYRAKQVARGLRVPRAN